MNDREQRAWGRLLESAPRGPYEHARPWELRNSRRRNFVKRIARTPGGCWVWTGPTSRVPDRPRYPVFYWKESGRTMSRSAFTWLLSEWFPDARTGTRIATLPSCGDRMCISPFHRYRANSRHGVVKLTPDQAREVASARGTVTAADLAARYGVSETTISNVWRGKRYANITGIEPPSTLRRHRRLTPDEALAVWRLRESGRTLKSVSAEYGVDPGTVRKIWLGRTWSHLTGAGLPDKQDA